MKVYAVLIILTAACFVALLLHPQDVAFIGAFVGMLGLCILWLGVYLLRHSSALTGYFLILVAVGMCGVIVMAPIVRAKGWLRDEPQFASEEMRF